MSNATLHAKQVIYKTTLTFEVANRTEEYENEKVQVTCVSKCITIGEEK
jgi:hypothetical protein